MFMRSAQLVRYRISPSWGVRERRVRSFNGLSTARLTCALNADPLSPHATPSHDLASTAGAPFADVCDRGATAHDAEDGPLTQSVSVCAAGAPSRATFFSRVGLAPCAASLAAPEGETGPVLTAQGAWVVPGSFALAFTVADSGGLSAEATRTVLVCPRTERVCGPGACSSTGLCLTDLAPEPPQRAPPTIALRTSDLLGAAISVKQFSTYAACGEGQIPELGAPCDLGTTAADTTDGDLSASVLTCPPSACLATTGCPEYAFAKKGIAGCVDTSAPVGTVFTVDFVVLNKEIPPRSATVARRVAISEPCAGAGETFCLGSCTTMACDYVASLLAAPQQPPAPPPAPPKLQLLGPATLFIPYGGAAAAAALPAWWTAASTPSAPSLLPCISAAGGSAEWPLCGSTASDAAGGDLSVSVSVAQSAAAPASCDAASAGGGLCLPVRVLSALLSVSLGLKLHCCRKSLSQSLVPAFPSVSLYPPQGAYSFVYRVVDSRGISATASRTVSIGEVGSLELTKQVPSAATNAAAAAAEAATFGAAAAAASLRANVSASIASISSSFVCSPGDVHISSVRAEGGTGGTAPFQLVRCSPASI